MDLLLIVLAFSALLLALDLWTAPKHSEPSARANLKLKDSQRPA